MLNQVMVMNIPKNEKRWYYMLGVLMAHGFPMGGDSSPWGNMIIRFPAHDGLDYPDREAVVEAAITDGFPYFNRFHRMKTRSTVAWCWTWASALRKIVEMNRTVLLLVDDRYPRFGWSYRRLSLLVRECARASHGHGTFRGIQLEACIRAHDIRPPYKPHTSMLHPGFAGCNDNAFILNAEGAKLLLEVHSEPPYDFPLKDILTVAQRGVDDPKYYDGLWHTLEPLVMTKCPRWGSDLGRKDDN